MFYDDMSKLKRKVLAHKFALGVAVLLLLMVGYFAASKTAVVTIEDQRLTPRTYKAGIRVLEQKEIPDPNYIHSSPQLVSIVCADGTKLFTGQLFAVVIGECD